MQKVIVSDYVNQSFRASIFVNLSDKPFWFTSYGSYFYAHNFDSFNLTDTELSIRDDYYKQLALSNIISQSNGPDDYKVLNPKCVAFALHCGFFWRPSDDTYKQNTSGASNGNIYLGTEINSNQPDIYLNSEIRKMLTTSFFNSLSDTTKLEYIRNILPFYTYENNQVALNLLYKLHSSGQAGIKTGQFIL